MFWERSLLASLESFYIFHVCAVIKHIWSTGSLEQTSTNVLHE